MRFEPVLLVRPGESEAMRLSHPVPICIALGVACACNDPGPTATPEPLFEPARVESEFSEVVPCKHSHEHELRHVRIFADPPAAGVFERCVLDSTMQDCSESRFPEGSLFVKYEYEFEGCLEQDLVSYTATSRLANGSYADGRDWHWQRLTPELEVTADGAPVVCLACHVEHCEPPHGFDLRCQPD